MQIATVGSTPVIASLPRMPESVEGPRPGHDGDFDDKGIVKSPAALAVGSLVDATA
jgi:hypothetical protein